MFQVRSKHIGVIYKTKLFCSSLENSLHLPIQVSFVGTVSRFCLCHRHNIDQIMLKNSILLGPGQVSLKVYEVHEIFEKILQLVPCQFINVYSVISRIKHAYPVMSCNCIMDLTFVLASIPLSSQ